MDILKRLRDPVVLEFDPYDLCDEAADEIERLREALRFYANERHYDMKLRQSSMGDYEWSEVTDDMGSVARSALGVSYDRHENQTTEA
jgi:hypothetical protein